MKTQELRDKLMEQRTLYQRSLEVSKDALQKIAESFASITEEQINTLLTAGIDIRSVLHMDLDRMTTDKEYLLQCEEQLNTVITQIHNYLEETLGV